jgi:SPP1 gp7 family putative phage head morphogenesis protein
MASVNEDLLEAAILGELQRRGLDETLVAEVVRVLRDEVLPDIANTLNGIPFDQFKTFEERLVALRNAIRESMGWDRVTNAGMRGLTDAATAEGAGSFAELNNALGFQWNTILPSVETLVSIVTETPFNGKLMGEWFGTLGEVTQKDIYEAFRVGMIEGKRIPDMAKDLLTRQYDAFTTGGITKAFQNAEATVRTAANAVQTRTRLVFAQENSDIIKGVEYVATLDDATTFICMNLHGNVYPVDELGPIPPQHYNCRSTLTYVTKSWEELGIDADEVQFEQRFRELGASRMDGIVAHPPSFDEFLKETRRSDPYAGNCSAMEKLPSRDWSTATARRSLSRASDITGPEYRSRIRSRVRRLRVIRVSERRINVSGFLFRSRTGRAFFSRLVRLAAHVRKVLEVKTRERRVVGETSIYDHCFERV